VSVLASTSTYWYLTRSTGAVAMILLSATVALGVVDLRRFATPAWPRFAVDELHRNLALLTLVFLVLHILTSVLDSFAPISLTASVIPFASSYRPFWLGLGAVSFDLLLAVTVTSLLRRRIGYGAWRAVHWLSYGAWPIALLHGFGTGSDVNSGWLQLLSAICVLAVLVAVLARIGASRDISPRLRGVALGGTAAFALFLVVWLPAGPLGSEWARRSGTPSKLLPKTRHAHR
jgi:predicted ferric reductase